MKKFKLFQILPLFAAILLVGCDRVEPGNVGIKVNKLGDAKALAKWLALAATGLAGIQRFTSSRPSNK